MRESNEKWESERIASSFFCFIFLLLFFYYLQTLNSCYYILRMENKPQNFFQRLINWIKRRLQWLAPGMGIKRWLAIILIGTTLIGLGFAVVILDFYRTVEDSLLVPVLAWMSLRFLSRPLRAIIFGGSGVALIVWGIWGLNRSLLSPFVKPGKPLLETVSAYRRRGRGPNIVVIGGGTGLSSLLRGLKEHTHNLTAIVTVADDGGSSGELRREMGVLPPGDIRNCLAALSNDEDMLTQVFQYRFSAGPGLEGHSLGNLLITALAEITGSFEEGVAESGRVLAVQGRVLPATLRDVRLVAEVTKPENKEDVVVRGESSIPKAGGKVKRIWLEPSNPPAFPPAIQALLSADLILIGPGSLYTSILPNLLVPHLAQAMKASRGLKFFVCNVATQAGETDGYHCGDHLYMIEKHLGEGLFDLVLCNNYFGSDLPEGPEWVMPEPGFEDQYSVYQADLVDKSNPWRHDSDRLAQVIMDLYYDRTGPLMHEE